MATNIIDRVIGWLNPRAGLIRHFDRKQLQRAYDAAAPRDKWKPRRAGASANADYMADGKILRDKARTLVQNVPYIASGLEALVNATVGTGVVPRGTGKEADKTKTTFAAWAKVCDADGRLDFNGIVLNAYRAMEQDGEVLIRKRPRFASDGLPVPLQLQLLEIDWLDTSRTMASGANRVINGIEYDVLGSVAAYWLWENHPGDVTTFAGMRVQSKRIDAQNIIHLYSPDRPGQGRGFTRLAPVITRVRDLQLYEDAELARKNLETRFGVLYSGDPSLIANPAASGLTSDASTIATTGELGDLPSGAMTNLPQGSNVTVVAPTVAAGYVDYVTQQLKLIASGMGVTYEQLTGDVREVNFSSARVRLLDFKRAVEQMQWLTLKPKLLDPLWMAFIDAGVLGGQFRTRDYSVDYSFPKWEYVNPEQDVAAAVAELSVGLTTVSEQLRQRGYDPDTVFAEIASDFEKMKNLKVLDILLFKETKKPAIGADPSATPPAAQAAARALDEAKIMLQRISQDVALLMARDTTINFKAGDITTNVAQAPAPSVEIRNEIPAQEPPTVVNNVTATPGTTEVRVENNVTTTPSTAEVRVVNEVRTPTVVNNVTVPKGEQVTDVVRDEKGRITQTRKRDV